MKISPQGIVNQGKRLKYPEDYEVLERGQLENGKDVVVMTPEMWDNYKYNFNLLNGFVQPESILRNMEIYKMNHQKR